jgi:hypothetical protein
VSFEDFIQKINERFTRTGFQGFLGLLPNNSVDRTALALVSATLAKKGRAGFSAVV